MVTSDLVGRVPLPDDAVFVEDSGGPHNALVLALKGATQVACNPDWVFRELHDPETLLSCVPGASLTRLVDSQRFEARIVASIGAFKIAYAGAGRIVDSDPKSRTASLVLDGHSETNMPLVRVRMSMAIHSRLRGSEIQMAFQVEVADRSGLLSRAWIDPVVREMLDQIIRRIQKQLEGAPLCPVPPLPSRQHHGTPKIRGLTRRRSVRRNQA